MKNKKFTYLLIVCVCALWGVIFYQIYLRLNNNDEDIIITQKVKKAAYFNIPDHAKEQLSLNFDYRDPFSDTENKTAPTIQSKGISIENKFLATQPIIKPQVNWQGILYTGYIKNPSTKKKIILMQLNGKQIMLAEGQIVDGLKLLKYAGDSVKVQYQNSTKFIILK
nr:hypothetical protein [Pedobacter sp. ASV2]